MDIGAALALLGLVLAWGIYRLERQAARQRDIDGALATLRALKRGMIGTADDPGWGEFYFSTIYDEPMLTTRATDDGKLILKGTFSQVYVVPTEPVRLLASAPHAGDLISDESVAAANTALWQIEVFNQLVKTQTEWLTIHSVEIADPKTPDDRKMMLAATATSVSHMLHGRGIGHANAKGGWYLRLKDAVDADIQRLGQDRSGGLWAKSDLRIKLVDLVAIVLAVALAVWIVIKAVS